MVGGSKSLWDVDLRAELHEGFVAEAVCCVVWAASLLKELREDLRNGREQR